MAASLIEYGSYGSPPAPLTVDFKFAPSRFDPIRSPNIRNDNYDATVLETLILPKRVQYRFFYAVLAAENHRERDLPLELEIEQFLVYAEDGGVFTFYRDRNEGIFTTTDAAVAEGDTLIPIASTAGITVGNHYVIRTPTKLDTIEVASVDTGVSVTSTKPIKDSYASGVLFRSKLAMNAHLISGSMTDLMPNAPYRSFEMIFQESAA